MIYETAGFTAALSINKTVSNGAELNKGKMKDNNLKLEYLGFKFSLDNFGPSFSNIASLKISIGIY